MAKELTFKANKNDKGEIISYSTRIYLGTDIKGKAIRKRETLSVKGMNSTEAKKALKEFEKECSKIQRATYSGKKLSTEKFQNYADYVLKMKEIKGCKSRCILEDEKLIDGKCVVCGKDAKHHVVWGIQY